LPTNLRRRTLGRCCCREASTSTIPQTLAVLLALAAKPERWSHDDDRCRWLDLKPGMVYPILIRLAERGLVVTAWEEDPPKGRPARHRYRISPDGAEFARVGLVR
jgi:PadR family transcriptional regulator, regulatory protein PadR